MAVFQTGISAGIAPGAYLAGLVADHAGGSAAYWVCVVSGGLHAGGRAALPARHRPGRRRRARD